MDDTRQTINDLTETLERLFGFVNERYTIVRDSEALRGQERLCAYELIGRRLWRETELLDSYVSSNPHQLSSERLDEVRELEDVLYGDYVLWRTGGSKAILLHPSGIYNVLFPEEYLPCDEEMLPANVRGAIACYRGAIAAVMPFTLLGYTSDSRMSSIVDENAHNSTLELVEDCPTFAERAAQWNESRKRYVQAASLTADGTAEGFHRSCLAGLCGEERKRARNQRLDEQLRGSEHYRASLEAKSIKAHYFPFSLKEGLELLDDDWLVDIYEDVGSGCPSHDLSRQELIEAICRDLLANEEERDMALLWCEDEQYQLLAALMKNNPLSLMTISPTTVVDLFPMIPYVFILQDDDAFVAWMPPEVRTFVSKADLSRIAGTRAKLREAARAADALATMCGIISLDDAYARYRRAVKDPLDRREFQLTLIELEDCMMRDSYALWHHDGTDYLVCVEISDASAPARVIRESYASHLLDSGLEPLTSEQYEPDEPISVEDEKAFLGRMAEARERLQQLRLTLLDAQSETPCELPRQMLTRRPVEALMETDRFRDLRAFVDDHIPDEENDLTFADVFSRAVIVSSLLMGESYEDTLDVIRLFGMQHCEGTEFSDTMGRLVTNAFNSLPRWGLCGRSLEENTRRLTGKKRLYKADGSVVEVADDEPCDRHGMRGRKAS